MIEPLLLACVQITTFRQHSRLTNASGFFFERGEHLYLVTSRHVLRDAPSRHFPDWLEIEIHTDADNMAHSAHYAIPLYQDGRSLWRQGNDTAGDIDVAVIEIDRSRLPDNAVWFAFTPAHIDTALERVEVGTPLLIVGFPLGFHDTLHHLPIARQAINASSFGLRFQGKGYFLTDARTHCGISGAPVVMKSSTNALEGEAVSWLLLGIHAARLDIGPRDRSVDEKLGLNSAWFADILLTLTR
jgi:S1-C subfamily serine protease